jgi:WD40 repeat protein
MDELERERLALDVFGQVCVLPPAERSARVDALCGGDGALRDRVESLLSADDEPIAPLHDDRGVAAFLTAEVGRISSHVAADKPPNLPLPAARVPSHYRILRVLGEGGMATVYEAEQIHPRRLVAIKVIRGGLFSAELRRRFEYEAQVLAGLQHPGIAQLYEAETRQEHLLGGPGVQCYLAMELIRGLPLDEYVTAHALGVPERLKLILHVCGAIEYAHRKGILHRDLKPANILVDATGQPKVLDFGVARALDRDQQWAQTLTGAGQLVGTLPYMSPEQVDPRLGAADTRCDVYALGVLLYKVLTGVLPIDVGSDGIAAAVGRICSQQPAKLGAHDRRLRGDLEAIVARALEKDPDRRYRGVEALADDLQRFLDGRAVEARGDSAMYVLRKAAWRFRRIVTLAVGILILIIWVAVNSEIQGAHNRQLATEATQARDASEAAKQLANANAKELRRLLYLNNIGFAHAAITHNDIARARGLLDACPPDLRGWEWQYLHRLRDLSRETNDLHLKRPRYASFSRDRSRVALATLDREVALIDVAQRREMFRVPLTSGSARAALSPDGRWLAYGGVVEGLVVLEIATGERRELTVEHARGDSIARKDLRVLRFTQDSRSLVAAGLDQLLRVWDVSTRTVRKTIRLGDPLPISMILSPDDTWAAVGDSKGGLRLFDLRTGELLHALGGHDAPVWSLALSADGKRLASGDNDAGAIIWDLESHQSILRADTNDGWITALCFSPDGSHLAVGRADSTIRLLDLSETAASGVLRGHRDAVIHVDWQEPDTLNTVSIDGTSKRWNADLELQSPTITTGQPESIGLAFDPSGRTVLVGGSDGTVRSWDVLAEHAAPALEGRRFGKHDGDVLEIAVDAAGGRVCTAGRDGVLRISPLDRDDKPPLIIDPRSGAISAVDFTRDGSRLIVGTQRELAMWDANTGRKLRDYSEPRVVANELTFDGSGSFFYAACADGHIRRWHVDSSRPVAQAMIDARGVYDARLSPNGGTVAVAGDTQSVTVVDAKTLQTIRRYVAHQGAVFGVAFHPSGERLASAGTDGSIRIWDVSTATELISLRGHRRRIQHVAFSPDGGILASSSDDGTVKLWRALPQYSDPK